MGGQINSLNFEAMGSGLGLAGDFMISCLFWSILQVILMQWPDLSVYKIERKTYLDLRNRMVSFIHGLAALILTAYQVFFTDQKCGDATNVMEYLILVNSGGYFLYDIIGMWWFGLLDFDMTFHHSLCIGGIIVVLL